MFLREVLFADRSEAGRGLAERLLRFKDERPVVLALPRGGVPVGFEVARPSMPRSIWCSCARSARRSSRSSRSVP